MEYKVGMMLRIATSVDTYDIWEIRGIVDNLIVYRVKHGRRYAYHVDHPDTLDLYCKAGRLTVIGEEAYMSKTMETIDFKVGDIVTGYHIRPLWLQHIVAQLENNE